MIARCLVRAAAAVAFSGAVATAPAIADAGAGSDADLRESIRVSGDYRSSSSLAKNPPAELAEIMRLTEKDGTSTGDLKLRLNLIRETANRYAQQKALVWRTDQINRILEGMSAKLDVIFDFDPLLCQQHP